MNVKYSKHLKLEFQKNRQKKVKATFNVIMKNMDIQNWQKYDFSYWQRNTSEIKQKMIF